MAAFSYPIALDVRNKQCVVVGGGNVGVRKTRALREADARVVVIDPCSEVVRVAGAEYTVAPFEPAHLDGAFLAVVATDRTEVNQQVAQAARERNILLNLAAPMSATASETDEDGDFATMATVRRGDLLLAVSAGGAGPALAARLRRELDGTYGPEWAAFAALMGDARRDAQTTISDPEQRAAVLRELANRDDIRELLAGGNETEARQRITQCR